MFVVVSGVSSSGKNTVIDALLKKRKDFKFLDRSSGTTREKKERDAQFNTYLYFSDEEFKKGVEDGTFFEYENVHGFHYGILLSRLNDVVKDKNSNYIRDVDVKGNLKLKEFFKDKCPMISIFIDAPDEVLRQRLLKRGDSLEEIEIRLSRGKMERSYKNNYDLIVENIDLDKTVQQISDFIDKHI